MKLSQALELLGPKPRGIAEGARWRRRARGLMKGRIKPEDIEKPYDQIMSKLHSELPQISWEPLTAGQQDDLFAVYGLAKAPNGFKIAIYKFIEQRRRAGQVTLNAATSLYELAIASSDEDSLEFALRILLTTVFEIALKRKTPPHGYRPTASDLALILKFSLPPYTLNPHVVLGALSHLLVHSAPSLDALTATDPIFVQEMYADAEELLMEDMVYDHLDSPNTDLMFTNKMMAAVDFGDYTSTPEVMEDFIKRVVTNLDTLMETGRFAPHDISRHDTSISYIHQWIDLEDEERERRHQEIRWAKHVEAEERKAGKTKKKVTFKQDTKKRSKYRKHAPVLARATFGMGKHATPEEKLQNTGALLAESFDKQTNIVESKVAYQTAVIERDSGEYKPTNSIKVGGVMQRPTSLKERNADGLTESQRRHAEKHGKLAQRTASAKRPNIAYKAEPAQITGATAAEAVASIKKQVLASGIPDDGVVTAELELDAELCFDIRKIIAESLRQAGGRLARLARKNPEVPNVILVTAVNTEAMAFVLEALDRGISVGDISFRSIKSTIVQVL